MSASRFADLPESPFARLASLIEGLTPGKPPIALSLGEPRHPFPAFIMEAIAANAADFGRYPPIIGTPAFRAAATGWLNRRFGLPEGWLDPENQLLPVNGTREALFNMAIVATPLAKAGKKPAILMPNPFYQCYAAAALAAGAEPVYVAATKENGFLPDFAALPEELLARTSMIYFCSPANPQGSVADLGYLKELILLARRHGILLAMDECYADIYDRAAPPGALKAAFELDGTADNVIVLHSLSKRSSLPGLRSGFCAGDRAFIAKFRSMRNIAAPQVPLPLLAASALAWADDAHAADNRTLYQRKIDMAERILGNRFGFYRPAGGFFLWLDVEDGEAATRRLWTEAGVKVLPGAYLARDDESVAGGNPGRAFIRVALVEAENVMEEALKRMAEAL
ncbi:MAG: aminotransferase class I/II-fold pyridoxal phosphate-dependent enzyme [Parvibaculaceae bacterium]|nr:aminotransferase class I/II-fold pyridoxal phosphate-dependent enzyme [Parvibaculaceae bacterium]